MPDTIDRRRFVKELLLGTTGAALIPGLSIARRKGGLALAGPPKHVVILGAGLAGLSAAYELERAGHTVTLIERRKKPGGRVQTIRGFDGGLYAEAGPVSFPSDHTFTWGYCEEFGLPVRPAFRIGFDQIANVAGKRFRVPAGGGEVPLDLTPQERQAGVFGLAALYMGRLMRDVGNPRKGDWPPDSLGEIDSISCGQLLREAGASQAAIELIDASALGLLGFGLDSISAMDAVVTEAIASGAPFHEIAGGNDQLPFAFRNRLRAVFRNKAIVRRIAQDETSVTVTYERKGNVQTVTADRCVCTLPFSVLQEVEVTPAFSPEKALAIAELKLTPVTRTYLQFSSRVWELDRLDGYGITDLVIQNTYSPTVTQAGPRGLLASYAAGQRALDLAAMSEADRQRIVRKRMGSLFTGVGEAYETGTSYIWQDEQYVRGAYTYFQPGQMTTLLPIAQQPEGRVHFAGEHTSAWHGWMNGALESGNRAAAEVNEAESAESITVAARSS